MEVFGEKNPVNSTKFIMSYERWMAGASEIIPKMDSLNAKSATLEQFQHIKDKINGFLSEEFEVDIDQITPDANLREVLALDSLDYIDLVAAIENNFSFKVKLEDLTGIITFSDFYGYIISHVQLKESGDGI